MMTQGSKFRKYRAALLRHCHAAWMYLKGGDRPPLIGFDVRQDAVPEEPAVQRLTSLERITKHLHDHGLGRQVQVRIDETGGGFILEDADGIVHAQDYPKAVVMIERIWLYQP